MIKGFASSGDPFLVYIPYTAPHYPIHAKPKDIAKYKGKFSMGWDELQKRRYAKAVDIGLIDPKWKLPPRDPEANPWAQAKNKGWQNQRMEVYAAMIDCVDQGIGRIMQALKDVGVDDNTLVLFLSDNGSSAESPGGENNTAHIPGPKEYYSHVGPSWAHAQNAPFRRYKSRMHEGGIATPLIAHWPGVVPKNTFTDQVGHVIDFLPTFLEMGGTAYPKKYKGKEVIPVEGMSLLEVFKSPAKTIKRDQSLCWAFAGSRAVREDNWKLVWDARVKNWELYDMAVDRTEMNDLSKVKPEVANKLRTQWENWAKQTGVQYKSSKLR